MRYFKLSLFLVIVPCFLLARNNIQRSVVKVYSTCNYYDYSYPWKSPSQVCTMGSGVVIDDKYILTAAHCVTNAVFVEVKLADEARLYLATVERAGHDCDLALLRVIDSDFYMKAIPLSLGSLPSHGDTVMVYGFPIGGDNLSLTQGTLARFEMVKYLHSGRSLLACQIDVSALPGNSGGPVLSADEKIVGITHQGFFFTMSAAGFSGFKEMVPVPIIKHFLKGVKEKKYAGFPYVGMKYQNLENANLRDYYRMQEGQTGVYVTSLGKNSCLKKLLEEGDIILSIDDKKIDNEGNFLFDASLKLNFFHLISSKFVGDKIKIEILRNKERKILVGEIRENKDSLLKEGKSPRYYIFGGLVFQPLTISFLEEWGGETWSISAPQNLTRGAAKSRMEGVEKVVLSRVLSDRVNLGYQGLEYLSISEVNGKEVTNMESLIAAFKDPKSDWHVIKTEEGYEIVLDDIQAKEANNTILKRYCISSDRSPDLKEDL